MLLDSTLTATVDSRLPDAIRWCGCSFERLLGIWDFPEGNHAYDLPLGPIRRLTGLNPEPNSPKEIRVCTVSLARLFLLHQVRTVAQA
jgi:hypothetical protein